MGCGPSKDTNVATGNTVKSKSLLKNDANESNNTTSTATAADVTEDTNTVTEKVEEDTTIEDTEAVVDKEEVEGKGNEDVEVKDEVQSALTPSEEEEEGKFIAAGSPDHYFSSRKDEEAVAGVTASAGPVPGIVDGETVEVVWAVAASVKEVESEKVVSDGNDEEEGETSRSCRTDSADFKEAISALGAEEENAAEVQPTENKNASMAASS